MSLEQPEDPRDLKRCVKCHHLVDMHNLNGCSVQVFGNSLNHFKQCPCVCNTTNIQEYHGALTYDIADEADIIPDINQSEIQDLLLQIQLLETSFCVIKTFPLDEIHYQRRAMLNAAIQDVRDQINQLIEERKYLSE